MKHLTDYLVEELDTEMSAVAVIAMPTPWSSEPGFRHRRLCDNKFLAEKDIAKELVPDLCWKCEERLGEETARAMRIPSQYSTLGIAFILTANVPSGSWHDFVVPGGRRVKEEGRLNDRLEDLRVPFMHVEYVGRRVVEFWDDWREEDRVVYELE